MSEVAWPPGPQPATLSWDDDGYGHLWFISPENGHRSHIWVTDGPDTTRSFGDGQYKENVWHIDVDHGANYVIGRIVTISPSIHFIGHFHTPNPVQFRLGRRVSIGADGVSTIV